MFPCDRLFSSLWNTAIANISIMLIFYGPIINIDNLFENMNITTFLKKKKSFMSLCHSFS